MPAIERIEENLGEIPRQVVADGGYTHWENVIAMDASGIDFIGSLMDRTPGLPASVSNGAWTTPFVPNTLSMTRTSDTYTCPEGRDAPA